MLDTGIRIPLEEVRDLLEVGAPFPFRVQDASGRLLLNAGHLLISEDQFESLVQRGAWVEGDLVEAERASRRMQPVKAAAEQRSSLFDEWERLLWEFDKLVRGLRRQEAWVGDIAAFAAELEQLIRFDPDIALFLCVRQDSRRFALYPLTHAIHCGVIASLTARHLGWDDARRASLVHAALTMNLSIVDLQATMAEQDMRPTPSQYKEIRAHPLEAVRLLRACGVADNEWLTTIAEHHEQHGGSGYPNGLYDVEDAAHVLRTIDVFMAKISSRVHRAAISPPVAMGQLFQQSPTDPLALAMIKTLGVYAPGTFVELRSGEVAVAIRKPVNNGAHPLVATLSDTQGRPSIATERRDTSKTEYLVLKPLSDTSAFVRLVPERVYGLVML